MANGNEVNKPQGTVKRKNEPDIKKIAQSLLLTYKNGVNAKR